MSEEAIQEDVSTEQEVVETIETTEEIVLSPRDQKLKEIHEQRAEAIGTNNNQPLGHNEENIGGIDVAPALEEEDAPMFKDGDGDWAMRIKINGEEVERKVTSIKATAQKHESADLRLEASNSRDKELNDREAQLNEREHLAKQYEDNLVADRSRFDQQVSENIPLSEQDAGGDPQDQAKALVEGIYDGDTDKVTEMLQPLFGRSDPTLDVEEVINQTTQAVTTRMEEEAFSRAANEAAVKRAESIQAGKDWLRENHEDLSNDPLYLSFVDVQTTIVANEDPNLSPKEVIQEATRRVVDKVGMKPTGSREDNKTKLRQPPIRQSAAYVAPAGEEEIDNSPKGVIARQKARRDRIGGRA